MSTNVETVEDIDAQIEALNARKAVMLKASREADMEICIGLVKKHGFTQAELGFAGKAKASKGVAKAPGVKVPAGTYADPKNPAKTWNAHGRKPQWFVDGLANGLTVEQMRVK